MLSTDDRHETLLLSVTLAGSSIRSSNIRASSHVAADCRLNVIRGRLPGAVFLDNRGCPRKQCYFSFR